MISEKILVIDIWLKHKRGYINNCVTFCSDADDSSMPVNNVNDIENLIKGDRIMLQNRTINITVDTCNIERYKIKEINYPEEW